MEVALVATSSVAVRLAIVASAEVKVSTIPVVKRPRVENKFVEVAFVVEAFVENKFVVVAFPPTAVWNVRLVVEAVTAPSVEV